MLSRVTNISFFINCIKNTVCDESHAPTWDDLVAKKSNPGKFVRYSPNAISINDPEALKAIYGHKANVRKSDFYLAFPAAPGVFSTHTAIDHHTHARKRRVMSYAFSEAALKNLEEFIIVHIQDFVAKVTSIENGVINFTYPKRGWTEPRNMASWCSYLGFDVMGDLCFGKSFGMLGDNPENREAVFLLCQAAKRHNTVRDLAMSPF